MNGFDVTRDHLPDGFLAIEASAGTGKTWTLSHLVVRLLLVEPALELRRILVVTFTNASADELAGRIRSVLNDCRIAAGPAAIVGSPAGCLVAMGVARWGSLEAVRGRLDRCMAGLDELHVGTIHAFCKQVLTRAAFASGESFAAELTPDDHGLICDAISDAWRARLWSDPQLAALAVQLDWSVEADAALWRRWNRHPATRIVPVLDLDTAMAALSDALHEVQAAATRAAHVAMQGWTWKSGKSAPDVACIAGLAADPWRQLAMLQGFAADPGDLVYLKFQEQARTLPLLVACRRLSERLAEVRIAWLGWLCPEVALRLGQTQAVAGVWTQDDLLRRVRAAMVQRPELVASVQADWDVALIDEFQDTDPVQWEIFQRCWGASGRLVVVGDPKQAIYRFRGADLAAYVSAVQGAERRVLTINRRSDPALVAAIQQVIGSAGLPFLDPGIVLQPVTGDPAARHDAIVGDHDAQLSLLLPPEDGSHDQAEVTASEIVALLRGSRLKLSGAVQPRDIAVLVRTANQGRRVLEALRRRGVPATRAATGDVLDSPAAAELRTILTALARPRDSAALRLAMATRVWGLTAADILALGADDQAWQEQVEQIEVYQRRWLRHGLTAAIEGWASAYAAMSRFAALPDGERWLTDWRHAIEVLHGESAQGNLRPAALLAWWARRGEEDAETRRLRLEGDASAVRILTMHVAKGLEFPIVFCPWIGYRHDREEIGALIRSAAGHELVLGGAGLAAAEAAIEAEDDAEQLRLAYVALTRACTRVYVCCGPWHTKGHYHQFLLSSLGWWLRPVGETAAAWRSASQQGVKDRSSRLQAALTRLDALAASDPAIRVRPGICTELSYTMAQPAIVGHGLRTLPAAIRQGLDQPRTITSFTGILGSQDGPPERRHGDEPAMPAASPPEQPTGLRALARGADVGDVLHRIIERWDLAGDPTELIRRELAPLGLDVCGPRQPHATDPVQAVATSLQRLALLPLVCAGRNLVLATLPTRLRRTEWEFHLPLQRVEAQRIRALIAAHTPVPTQLISQLPRLRDGGAGGGFLKGFVDLLAGDGTAWWVLDWKSNHLGDRLADYAEDRLWTEMIEHGYLVQALLYILALHRHLRHRLGADYDYDMHVAGAAWVFLRGVDAGLGVWTWKPPLALIEALETELLGVAP